MKLIKSLLFAICALLVPSHAWTDDNDNAAEHATHHPAATPDKSSPATAQSGMEDMMSAMQDHMEVMQRTMQKAHAAKSAAEREKLLAEHMTQMQEQMNMMMDMKSGGGMCGMKDKKNSGGMGMMGGDGMQCGMMDKMGMMQQMMAQMLDHMSMAHPSIN